MRHNRACVLITIARVDNVSLMKEEHYNNNMYGKIINE